MTTDKLDYIAGDNMEDILIKDIPSIEDNVESITERTLTEEESDQIISDCQDFLCRSSDRFNDTLTRAMDDLQMYSGNFWTEDLMKEFKRGKNRLNLSINQWTTLVNAISSPFSSSPYHVELTDKKNSEELQKEIDKIESDNDSKLALTDAFRKAIISGYGFIVATTVEDELNGEPKFIIESPKNLLSIAMDPNIDTLDGSDAEEGAVVNFISVKKAKRLYGDDVVPFDYPRSKSKLSLAKIEQWNIVENTVAIVAYYVKNENDTVDFYKICGDKVISMSSLPTKIIPITRFVGNEIYENQEVNYNGIIQSTLPLMQGLNSAYSSLIERCSRTVKANYLMHVDSLDGLEDYYAKANQDDSVLVLWKGINKPEPLIEQFQTGDLQNVISLTRTLIEDVAGVQLTGIQNAPQKTATEILRQEVNNESNVSNYYNHAMLACRTLGRIMIQMYNDGNESTFTLENGPLVITRRMKERQQLQAVSTLMPDNMKPLVAKYYADSLDDNIGEDLSRNIVANLPAELKLIADNEDPNAVHVMKQMQALTDSTMQQLEESNQKLLAMQEELKVSQEQLRSAEAQLINNRESRQIDMAKFEISENNKMALEQAKLEQDGIKHSDDLQLKAQQNAIKAATEINKSIEKNNEILGLEE